MKITMKDLKMMLNRINELVPGHELDGAYGGWKLAFVGVPRKGYQDVLGIGFTTKKDLFANMCSYFKGLEVSTRLGVIYA